MPAPVETDGTAEFVVKPEYQAACEPFFVVNQEVELDINFREQSVSGTSTLVIFRIDSSLEEVSIDARQCYIDTENIYIDGVRTKAWFNDPYDLLNVPHQWQLGPSQHHLMKKRIASLIPDQRPDVPIREREKPGMGCVPNEGTLKISLRPEDRFVNEPQIPIKLKADISKTDEEGGGIKISIPFRSKRIRDGLHFVGMDEGDNRYPHVYTRHSVQPGTASCIFPCIDDPGQRNPFKISIKCPRTLGDVLHQALATQHATGPDINGNRKRNHGEAVPQQPQSMLTEEDKLLDMTVVCSGNLIGEHIDPEDEQKKTMTFECQNAAALHIGFAVGPFETIDLWSDFRTEESDEKLGANATKVHGYCLPGRTEEVRNTCAPLVAAADYFALEFGKFPFESYKACFVEDMIPDTAEATSLSLCSTRLLYPEDIIDTEIEVTRTLIHSLASQYLGVHLVPNQRSDTWLVVGLRWFMTDIFMKTLCGLNWYKFHLKKLSDKLVETDVGRPSLHDLGEHLHVGDFEREFLALKAPLVLYILDQRMIKYPGSTGLMRVISGLVSGANISNTNAEKTSLSHEEFRTMCEKRSQYKNELFWTQWVHGSGCPRFNIKTKFNKKNLNVDIVINQTQANPAFDRAQTLNRDDFWREYQEEIHNVFASEVQRIFQGPITVRIHEADGTPYEHYLDLREDTRFGTSWSISYNTKYKRLKRKGRQKDPGNVAAANLDAKNEVQEDDVVYFNMFGDVLLADDDVKNWGLQDWDKDVQKAMDEESYEWIRFDCNFEWLCDMVTDMPGYMYLAQLQQDRDVVAHQDAMLFWTRGPRHPVASSIETRTLYDKRYYHGIRTMAINDLPKQASLDLNLIGLAHLILAFRHFFCYKVPSGGVDTWPPGPNDFTDRAQYAVQSAIPGAIARVRGDKGRCPKSARNFLMDLLLFNDNASNDFSDHFYIAKLLDALTTSLIVEPWAEAWPVVNVLNKYNDDDIEFKQFIEKTIEEIDRYRRMDEWTCSYQNIWTTTALECKKKLMKAKVIPVAPLEFLQYLQDDNIDLVRIKAFECLVELGMISKPPILKLLLAVMSTDSSPFIRERLFKIFCKGIASIAFGENKAVEKPPTPENVDVEDDGLIIEQGEAITEARKAMHARREDINAALAGLKEDVKGNKELSLGIWKAFESTAIGLEEKRNILELCQAMFEPEDNLLITLKYPRAWNAARAPKIAVPGEKSSKKKCVLTFTSHYRMAPRNPLVLDKPALPPAAEDRPPEPKKIKLQSRPSMSGGLSMGNIAASIDVSQPPPILVRQPSISIVRKPVEAAIAVQAPAVRPSTPVPSPPVSVPSPQPNGTKSTEKRPKAPKKRKSDENESSDRPKKIAKTATTGVSSAPIPAAKKRRRIVRVPFSKWNLLREDTLRSIEAERAAAQSFGGGTIVATPQTTQRSAALDSSSPTVAGSPVSPDSGHSGQIRVATSAAPPSNGGSAKARKPLPSSAKHGSPPASAAVSEEVVAAAPAPAVPSAPFASKPKLTIKLKLPGLKPDPQAPQP